MKDRLKTLIIRAGALGDTLMLMPAICGLRKDTGIIIIGRRPGIDYLRPYVDQCVDIETSGLHRLFMEDADNLSGLSLPSPDLVAAFLNDPDGRLTCRLKACFPESSINIFPVFPPEKDKRHIALYMAKAIQETGIPIDADYVFKESFKFPLMPPKTSVPGERGLVVIHPGSGSRVKNYPPAFWLQLIREIKRMQLDNAGRMLLLMGPAEEDVLPVMRDTLKGMDIAVSVLPEKEELISILARASVYIGHDSGVTHLAAMLGTHVIALFNESPINRWRPLGPNVRIIAKSDFKAFPDNSPL